MTWLGIVVIGLAGFTIASLVMSALNLQRGTTDSMNGPAARQRRSPCACGGVNPPHAIYCGRCGRRL